MPTDSQDLLVAAPDRWDEACFSVPAMRALIASGLGVGVICPPEQKAFWETVAELTVIPLPPKPGLIAAAIQGAWSAALLWQDGPYAKATKKAGIARRIGPAAGKLGKWLTDPLNDAPQALDHRVRFYLCAVEEMGVPTAKPEFFAPASIDAERIEGAILLAPDSDFGPSHEWPIERWQALASSLVEQGRPITIACQNGLRSLGTQLAEHMGEAIATQDIELLTDHLPFLATQDRVIAADGSLPHLASHAGATCLTLFGPNDPAWKRPLGKRHLILKQHVPCAPCLLAKCPLDLRCQEELGLEWVQSEVSAYFARA